MPTAPATMETPIHRFAAGVDEDAVDQLAVEEPLEIRLGFVEDGKPVHRAISITMRTPGNDGELAAGFLFTQGIFSPGDEVRHPPHCGLSIGGGKGPLDRAPPLTPNPIRSDLPHTSAGYLKNLKPLFYPTIVRAHFSPPVTS